MAQAPKFDWSDEVNLANKWAGFYGGDIPKSPVEQQEVVEAYRDALGRGSVPAELTPPESYLNRDLGFSKGDIAEARTEYKASVAAGPTPKQETLSDIKKQSSSKWMPKIQSIMARAADKTKNIPIVGRAMSAISRRIGGASQTSGESLAQQVAKRETDVIKLLEKIEKNTRRGGTRTGGGKSKGGKEEPDDEKKESWIKKLTDEFDDTTGFGKFLRATTRIGKGFKALGTGTVKGTQLAGGLGAGLIGGTAKMAMGAAPVIRNIYNDKIKERLMSLVPKAASNKKVDDPWKKDFLRAVGVDETGAPLPDDKSGGIDLPNVFVNRRGIPNKPVPKGSPIKPGGMLGRLGTLARFAGGTAAVAGAGYAGYQAGEWLNENTNIQEGVASSIESVKGWFGKSDKDKFAEAEKNADIEYYEKAKKEGKKISPMLAESLMGYGVKVDPNDIRSNVSVADQSKMASRVESVTQQVEQKQQIESQREAEKHQQIISAPSNVNNSKTIVAPQTISSTRIPVRNNDNTLARYFDSRFILS